MHTVLEVSGSLEDAENLQLREKAVSITPKGPLPCEDHAMPHILRSMPDHFQQVMHV